MPMLSCCHAVMVQHATAFHCLALTLPPHCLPTALPLAACPLPSHCISTPPPLAVLLLSLAVHSIFTSLRPGMQVGIDGIALAALTARHVFGGKLPAAASATIRPADQAPHRRRLRVLDVGCGETLPLPCASTASAAKDTAFAVAGAMPCAMCACAVLPMVLPQATELLGCCCTRPRARPGAPSSQRRRTVVLLHFPPHCFAGASVGMQGGCQRIHRTGVSYRCPADLTAIDIGAPSAPAPARPKRRHLGRFGQVWSSLWCHDAPPTPRHSPPTCPRRPVEQHTSGVCFLYELGC